MTTLKCVGGPHDGEWHGVLGGHVVMTMTRYTVRTLRVSVDGSTVDDEIRYLAPVKWTDMQAIRHQFSK